MISLGSAPMDTRLKTALETLDTALDDLEEVIGRKTSEFQHSESLRRSLIQRLDGMIDNLDVVLADIERDAGPSGGDDSDEDDED